MRYVVIIPAYNEEHFLPATVDALLAQHLRPVELVIVDDGSSDNTAGIIEAYARQHTWIRGVHVGGDKGYAGGAKIVAAFYRGYEALATQEYDFLVKLDADIVLEANYFERVAAIFTDNPQVGLAGGMLLTEKNGEWVYENIADRDHVKGAFKAWRKAAFEAMGQLRPTIGWDTADEMLIQYHGWDVKVDESLPVRHFRPLGTKTGFIKIRVRIGYGFYRLRYGFFISLVSAIKAGMRSRPYVLSGLATLYGYMEAWWRGDAFAVSEDEGRFIRQYRWQRMRAKLGK
jgi:glycosyltransferase involved in cell wall biosynthesis